MAVIPIIAPTTTARPAVWTRPGSATTPMRPSSSQTTSSAPRVVADSRAARRGFIGRSGYRSSIRYHGRPMTSTSFRSHTCGELRASQVGERVTLAGWVHRRRDHGHLTFFDLRDRHGITQVVTSPDDAPDAHAAAEPARSEWVVQVTGIVRARPDGHGQRGAADRRDRGRGRSVRGAQPVEGAAVLRQRGAAGARRVAAPEASVPGPPPSADAGAPPAARPARLVDPSRAGGRGLRRDRDADPHPLHA